MADVPAMSASAYHIEGTNKEYIGIKTELVTRVPLDTGLLLHLLREAILSQQLIGQRKREGILEHQSRPPIPV